MKRWYAILVVVLLSVASLGCLDSPEEEGATESVESATQTEIGGSETIEETEETLVDAEPEEEQEQEETQDVQVSLYDRSEITTAEEAWAELMKGNERYVAGESAVKDLVSRRNETVSAQHPFVTVVTCSDSRVSPELLFDQGIGDIFVIRTAGNVVRDPSVLGSIEYGVEHLQTPLLLILGHQSCGAVTAAVEGEAEGNIGSILEEIKPAVDTAKDTGKEDHELIEEAVNENVGLVIQNALNGSSVVNELVENGDLKIIGAKYFLDSGKVEIIEQLPAEEGSESGE